MLNAFDHEKQAALTTATEFLRRLTRREVDALDLRVGVLLGEAQVRDIDNPFAPDYILDAIGVTSRALLPNPRVWRPLMERVLGDLTPAATKTYIRLNRLLADRQYCRRSRPSCVRAASCGQPTMVSCCLCSSA